MTAKNGADAAPTLTLGATWKRLAANGYHVGSALSPGGYVAGPGVQVVSPNVALWSEHLAAIQISVLIIGPIEDGELSDRVRAVLDKHGLLTGPARLGSDGVAIRPINLDSRNGGWRGQPVELDGAVAFLESATLPLDGRWNGSLLDVPAADLPTIEGSALRVMFEEELRYLASRLASERRPPPKPSRRGFVGR